MDRRCENPECLYEKGDGKYCCSRCRGVHKGERIVRKDKPRDLHNKYCKGVLASEPQSHGRRTRGSSSSGIPRVAAGSVEPQPRFNRLQATRPRGGRTRGSSRSRSPRVTAESVEPQPCFNRLQASLCQLMILGVAPVEIQRSWMHLFATFQQLCISNAK